METAQGARPAWIKPASEGGYGVFCGEADDGGACASSRDRASAQGTDLPGVLIQHEEAGDNLFARHRGFLMSMSKMVMIVSKS